MRDLQLGALIPDDGPVFGPVELESLARREGQRHECAAACGLQFALPIRSPFPGKGGNTIVKAIEA